MIENHIHISSLRDSGKHRGRCYPYYASNGASVVQKTALIDLPNGASNLPKTAPIDLPNGASVVQKTAPIDLPNGASNLPKTAPIVLVTAPI
jgi:hypothetical protein